MTVIYDKEHDCYHGINREAKRLGVSQAHLSMVLNGKRQSKKLMAKVKIKEVK